MFVKEILKQVLHNKPNIHIGKAGITDAVIVQIKQHYRNKKIIKIKFLSLGDYDNMNEAAKVLSIKSNSKILDIRGKTCVIMDLSKNKNLK